MTFYSGPIPQSHKTSQFTFLPLAPKFTQLDYDALMASKPTLRDWGAGDWPRDDFTLEENRADLQQHWDEFESGEAYAYTVLNHDETRCEGCLYINPQYDMLEKYGVLDKIEQPIGKHDALVRFWIREERLADEAQLLDTILSWLRSEWEFTGIYFVTNNINDRQIRLFEAAGLQNQFDWSHNDVKWLHYMMA